jgi:Sister chromatid cohesion protein Dcc1
MNEMEVDGLSKESVYNNIPLSKSEIDRDWESLCVFEHSNVCYIPTNAYMFIAWKSMLSASFAEDIDISDPAQDSVLWKAVSDEDIPGELIPVILYRSRTPTGAIWIARLLLESLESRAISRDEFTNSLKDVLARRMSLPDTFEAFKVRIKIISLGFLLIKVGLC